MQREPMTALGEGAASHHELYLAYREAGFTDAQAMYLVGIALWSALNGPTSTPADSQ
jgi:hypothetical protein